MTSYVFDAARQAAFNAAYWAAQSPAIRAAAKIADFAQRGQAMEALAQSGASIDRALHVWLWDPYQTMLIRWSIGYTWVPNILQSSISPPPGFALPGQAPYDPNHPPAASILVHDPNAFDLTVWFPPFDPPPPAPPVGAVTRFVDLGRPWPEMNGWFSTPAGYSVEAGQPHVDPDGKTYVKIVMPWPFGAYHGWKLQ